VNDEMCLTKYYGNNFDEMMDELLTGKFDEYREKLVNGRVG